MSDPQMIAGASDSAIADWLEARLRAGLAATSGPVAITVPGGATPFPILAELAGRSLDWPRITVWPGDERIVAEHDPASNVGRIRAALTQTGAQIVPLEETSAPPHFALAWLGMGGDGHIASLFPSGDPRADDPQPVRRLTPDPLPTEAPFERLTLTIPALLASDALLFVIRGEAKRALFEAAAAGLNDLPVARLLRAASQGVTCFT
jgi:6-phosphogluconolactonase